MKIEEAINHSRKKGEGDTPCAQEHKQLEGWLRELKWRREKDNPVPVETKEEEFHVYGGIALRSEILDAQGDVFSKECLADMMSQGEGTLPLMVEFNTDEVIGFAKSHYDPDLSALCVKAHISKDCVLPEGAIAAPIIHMIKSHRELPSGACVIDQAVLMGMSVVEKHADDQIKPLVPVPTEESPDAATVAGLLADDKEMEIGVLRMTLDNARKGAAVMREVLEAISEGTRTMDSVKYLSASNAIDPILAKAWELGV